MVQSRKLPVARQRIEDVDAMAAAATDGLSAEYVQLESRPFSGHWLALCAPAMVVQVGREDISVARRLRVPMDRWAVVFPIMVADSARWNASAIRSDETLICGPGEECFAFDPGGTRFAVFSFNADSATARRLSVLSRDCAPSGIAVLQSDQAYALRRDLLALTQAVRPQAVGLAGLIQTSLAHAVPRSRQTESFVGRSQIVQRVENFFRHHMGEPLSIAQLSSVAGVSERSLRNAFYDVYTTSPKRYLKLWQLHQVRRALRAVTSEEGTVTDVATLHGFYELGRFAGEYKALFGEAPSQTLHKARTRKTSAALRIA
jgi:AraC-like DNA-binding protein